MNFVVSLLSSLTAYTHQPIKAFSSISVKKWPGVLLFFLRQLQVNLSILLSGEGHYEILLSKCIK